MITRKTEQESFWEGQFGDEYALRNQGANLISSNINLFSKILARTNDVGGIIEFGANIGNNLKALHQLLPTAALAGIEINELAAEQLRNWGEVQVFHDSILEFNNQEQWDMSLIKGVLIHISPERLNDVYDRLYKASKRYICLVEYYNPTPVEVNYRGHTNRLFKRDFAGEILDRFADLTVVDYGFVWHRDPTFPLDDCSWFLLEKRH